MQKDVSPQPDLVLTCRLRPLRALVFCPEDRLTCVQQELERYKGENSELRSRRPAAPLFGLGPPARCPFAFFLGGRGAGESRGRGVGAGRPTRIDDKKKVGTPYSNLSTEGPSGIFPWALQLL